MIKKINMIAFLISCACILECSTMSTGPQPLVPGLKETENSLIYVHTWVDNGDCENGCRPLLLQIESIDGIKTGGKNFPGGLRAHSKFPSDVNVGKKSIIIQPGNHKLIVSVIRIKYVLNHALNRVPKFNVKKALLPKVKIQPFSECVVIPRIKPNGGRVKLNVKCNPKKDSV